MLLRSRAATDVLLDASVLCYFARHGLLPELREYLGARARVTPDVERELLRLSARPEFAQLRDHLDREGVVVGRCGKWPKHTKNLPDRRCPAPQASAMPSAWKRFCRARR